MLTRTRDPETSHEAAAAASLARHNCRRLVWRAIQAHGPCSAKALEVPPALDLAGGGTRRDQVAARLGPHPAGRIRAAEKRASCPGLEARGL